MSTQHPADLPPLPERDGKLTNRAQGAYRKFDVRRTDGSDQLGGKHHGCEYFVLDVTHDPHAKAALQAYADACENTHMFLAADMRDRYVLSSAQAQPSEQRLDDFGQPIVYDTDEIDQIAHALTGDEGEDDAVTVLHGLVRYLGVVHPGKNMMEVLTETEEASLQAQPSLTDADDLPPKSEAVIETHWPGRAVRWLQSNVPGGSLLYTSEQVQSYVRAAIATQAAQPGYDSMGTPKSCGGALCRTDEHHPLCEQAAQPEQPVQAQGVPDGFELVAVNSGFDDLIYWLNRCEEKGHLENCSDLIEPWAAFDYRLLAATPQAAPQQAQGVPAGYALVKLRDEEHRQQLIGDAIFSAPQQAEPYPGYHDEIAKAIGELSIAMGSPAVFVKRPASLLSETVRRAAFLLAQTPQQAEPLSPLTDEQIEKLRQETFSTNNPFCPCDSKTMRKAVWAAEYAHGIKGAQP